MSSETGLPTDRRNRPFPYITPELGAPEAEYVGPTLHITSQQVSMRLMSLFSGMVVIHLSDDEAERVAALMHGEETTSA